MPFKPKPTNTSDEEIISYLIKDGHDRKQGEDLFFKKFIYFIGQAVHKYSFTEEESFDIYTDTILAASGRIGNHGFDGRSTLKTWLFQIFHHKCVDFIRKKTTNKEHVHHTLSLSNHMVHLPDSAKSVIQQMIEKVDVDRLRLKLKELGETCQKLLMFWAEGYHDREIAMAMEYKSADVVKTSRLRCLERLRLLYKSDSK